MAQADCLIGASRMLEAVALPGQLKVEAPFVSSTKAEVVKTGLELNVPYELTWSCYEGGEKPCGVCGTCIDRAEAFRLNGVKDPALDR